MSASSGASTLPVAEGFSPLPPASRGGRIRVVFSPDFLESFLTSENYRAYRSTGRERRENQGRITASRKSSPQRSTRLMIRPVKPLRHAWAYTRWMRWPRSGPPSGALEPSTERPRSSPSPAPAAGRPSGRSGRLFGESALSGSTAAAVVVQVRCSTLTEEDCSIASWGCRFRYSIIRRIARS